MWMAALLLLASQGAAVGPAADLRCYVRDETDGVVVLRYIGDRACVPLEPPREMSGVWLRNYEGSEFIEGRRSIPERSSGAAKVWFSLDDKTVWATNDVQLRYGRAYRVRLVGRAAEDMNREPLSGYGHMSMSAGLVLADKILEITDIGPTSAAAD